ncbi:LysE family transporter [Rheinheimera sp.]|uniref:LysE family transporter n=1 Tax=Rheinheimera sp. TaxID=1869214 RepID=UPI0025CCA08A|nr:LysE family transporter [Rheinheimera sp.]
MQAQPAWFTVGACLASFIRFSSLTALAPKLKTVLSSPKRWRVFDVLVAMILAGIAIKLAVV